MSQLHAKAKDNVSPGMVGTKMVERDIRQRVLGNLHPLMTNIPASSMYSVRSGPPTRGRTSRSISVPNSPLATSSNASSEVSVSNNVVWVDGSEIDEDISSDKGARSHASVRGRCSELVLTWMLSKDSRFQP
ncbi:hypothetical protein KY290_017596 [Solanum tuberosum]|uniref:ATP binding protein n=1 Tax=Solanum tuberosum TaxID=4113 RepID=A0ABQ7VBQ8_SOLTU|nr:hypothetical protein KY290_017596 [Solanum tuberosum]